MKRQAELFSEGEVDIVNPSPKNVTHCNDVGTIAEHAFALHAAENGFTVFLPLGHAQSVDMVIMEEGGQPLSVQVKQAQLRDSGVYRIPLSRPRPSYRGKNGDGMSYRKYQSGEFDIVAGYLAPLKSFWLAWLDDVCGVTSRSIDPGSCSLNNWSILKREIDKSDISR